MFKELKKSPIVQRIEEYGCTDLAAKLGYLPKKLYQ